MLTYQAFVATAAWRAYIPGLKAEVLRSVRIKTKVILIMEQPIISR